MLVCPDIHFTLLYKAFFGGFILGGFAVYLLMYKKPRTYQITNLTFGKFREIK